MAELHFIIPGDLDTRTGGYLYDKKIISGLAALGWSVTVHALSEGFPHPDAAELAEARNVLSGIADHSLVIVDGLALGGMPDLISEQADRLRFIGLVHHPLAEETGLNARERMQLYHSERAALISVARVIVTSPATARTLQQEYAVTANRIGVVLPGTDPAPQARGSDSQSLSLLCVASFTPRKGHAILLEALAQLQDRPWRLVCIGSLDRDTETVHAIKQQLDSLNLRDRIELISDLEPFQLAEYYQRSDLFVLPSYLEGYGMALSEALASGLPIVSTTGGAIPETVPADAGLLVPPGDSKALRDVLERLMDDVELRQHLAQGARNAGLALPSWETACALFVQELEQVPAR
ncbi:MAG: glycosyltransferase family 4 protein [Candidatus Competibacteraceae bacterium]|jgi:glycosyltransferase involved in cell wall biosynthesis|nr:glycosyltransferase family 4 protein [Candidatus Competibacteraceae bacterium]